MGRSPHRQPTPSTPPEPSEPLFASHRHHSQARRAISSQHPLARANRSQVEGEDSRHGKRRASGEGATWHDSLNVDSDDDGVSEVPRPSEAGRAPPSQPHQAHQPRQRHAQQPGRIASSQDLDPNPLSVRMKRIFIGTFDCGAAEVTFEKGKIRWFPNNPVPREGFPLISLDADAMSVFEVDKARGSLCLRGMWELPYIDSGQYAPFLSTEEPESSIFMEYYKEDYPMERGTSWPSKIMEQHPKYRNMFRPVEGHRGRRENRVRDPSAPAPAAKRLRSSMGSRQQAAAAEPNQPSIQQSLVGRSALPPAAGCVPRLASHSPRRTRAWQMPMMTDDAHPTRCPLPSRSTSLRPNLGHGTAGTYGYGEETIRAYAPNT
jgi:hypothetical protein